uniref:Uncharacterized protein n=1 Tax=Strigamia maritima TaxID=126957 RepID=T1J858_STRMM
MERIEYQESLTGRRCEPKSDCLQQVDCSPTSYEEKSRKNEYNAKLFASDEENGFMGKTDHCPNRRLLKTRKKKENSSIPDLVSEFTSDQCRAFEINYENEKSPSTETSLLSSNWSPSTSDNEKRFNFKRSNTVSSENALQKLKDELKKLNSDVKFIDTHCHLDFLFKQSNFKKNSHLAFQELHKDSYPSCYEGCVAIFCDPTTFKENTWKEIVSEDNVWAAFGCHPHNADLYNDEIESDMKTALKHKKVVALGEIGLDYSSRNFSNRQKQKEIFRRQLKLALEHKLPVVIHSRDATDDSLEIMKEILPSDHKIHRHCFTNNWAEAKTWLKEFSNLYLGLTNLVTFANAVELHEVAKKMPLERLLLETDAPYFVPRLDKGKRRSHPGMAIYVAAEVASLRSESLETILKLTRANTLEMYRI